MDVNELMQQTRDSLTVTRLFGEPYERNGVTVIPVAIVRGGGGGGRGEGAGPVRVNPTGVNVNSQGATSVFLTFGGLTNQVPAEAFWCGALMSAAPAIGQRCDPATVFGRLPARLDLSRGSGSSGFTDIMSIPASVSRRAFQDAQSGATSSFFYVRRFVSLTGAPDEYVAGTCRMAGGGARVPFGPFLILAALEYLLFGRFLVARFTTFLVQ